jgi:hypothetical protein
MTPREFDSESPTRKTNQAALCGLTQMINVEADVVITTGAGSLLLLALTDHGRAFMIRHFGAESDCLPLTYSAALTAAFISEDVTYTHISLQESFEQNLVFEERCTTALELEQKSGFMHDACTLKPSIQGRENYNLYVYHPLTSEKPRSQKSHMKKWIIILAIVQAILIWIVVSVGFAKGDTIRPNRRAIPLCSIGELTTSWLIDPSVVQWVASHPGHRCAKASILHVCRDGRALRVRCE